MKLGRITTFALVVAVGLSAVPCLVYADDPPPPGPEKHVVEISQPQVLPLSVMNR